MSRYVRVLYTFHLLSVSHPLLVRSLRLASSSLCSRFLTNALLGQHKSLSLSTTFFHLCCMQTDEQTGADMLRELKAFLGPNGTRNLSHEWLKDSEEASPLM